MELPDAVAMTLEMLEVETEPEEIHETLVDVGVPTALAKELVRGCTIAFASLDDDPEESALIDHLCAEGIGVAVGIDVPDRSIERAKPRPTRSTRLDVTPVEAPIGGAARHRAPARGAVHARVVLEWFERLCDVPLPPDR